MGAKGVGDQALSVDFQGELPLAAAQHQRADGDLAGLLHGLPDDGEGLGAETLVGHDVEGVVPVEAVDLILVHELVDGDGAGGLKPHLVEVLVVHEDVLVPGDLIALDQIRPLDRPGVRVGRDHADAVVGVRIDQVEADALGRGGGGV